MMPARQMRVEGSERNLDPKMMSDACDEVRAALSADDPISALRAVAIAIAGRGLGRAGVEAVFVSVCEELADAGRDEESTLVAYVLDMVEAW